MLFNKLNQQDINILYNYISAYSGDEATEMWPIVTLDELLEPWNKYKSKYLYKMFDDKLVISKKFKYNDDYYFNQELTDFLFQETQSGFLKQMQYLYGEIRIHAKKLLPPYHTVFNFVCFQDNHYKYTPFNIESSNHKAIEIKANMKMMKLIHSILLEYKPEWLETDFEDFRIRYSRLLVKRPNEVEVYLSIHPMDFLTMGDSPYFTTCTDWRRKKSKDNNIECTGTSRAGVVEMMNSPMVIIAYIKGRKSLNFHPTGEEDVDWTWNGKRWRALYIINQEIISNLRSYPYEDETLDKMVMEWIKELVNKKVFINSFNSPIRDKAQIKSDSLQLEACSGDMYNDYMLQKDRKSLDILSDFVILNQISSIKFNYAGPRECMCCGELYFDNFDYDTSQVVCDACAGREDFYDEN